MLLQQEWKNTSTEKKMCASYHQPKIDNNPNVLAYANHRYVIIRPSNFGKTYYMLENFEKTGHKRPIHIITRSPSQYPTYKTSNEIKPKVK